MTEGEWPKKVAWKKLFLLPYPKACQGHQTKKTDEAMADREDWEHDGTKEPSEKVRRAIGEQPLTPVTTARNDRGHVGTEKRSYHAMLRPCVTQSSMAPLPHNKRLFLVS